MQGVIYPYTYRPQGLVAAQVSGGSAHPWEQDSPAYFRNPQSWEDAYSIGRSGRSIVWYVLGIDGYWTRYEGFQLQPSPAFPGHEDVAPAPIEAAHVNVIAADVATAYTSYHDSWTDHVPMSAFPDQSHPFPPVDESPNVQVSPTLGTQKSFSTSVEHEASSPLSEEELEKPYKCSYPGCGKRFQVPQSVGRHYRKNHDPNTCMYSNDGCDFRWGGPYDYRCHLNVTHELENEVINAILGKRADSYDRATIVGRKPFTPSLYITN